MPRLPRLSIPCLMLVAMLALAGCQSSEEKAEGYFQSGMTLLAAGDEDRALVEFRNVFKYNGFHKEARKIYANTVLKRGDVGEAYGQYLRLIEQYPDTPEVRLTLSELAIGRGDWEEAERHGREAIRLAPDMPGAAGIAVALDYRTAVMANDGAARQAAAERARALLGPEPDNRLARRLVIDYLMTGLTPAAALPEIDRALEREPDALDLHVMKFRLLAKAEDIEGTGAQLKTMFERFPDNQEVRGALIGWYLAQKDIDGAEAFLRQLAGDITGPAEGHLAVVQLLQTARGPEAAATELDRLIAANEGTTNADLYRALKAGLDFEAGRQTEAIAAMETLLAAAEPSDQTRRIKVMLARMLEGTGNRVGARARIEEVLTEDATMTEALKMRAAWLIDEDKPGDAIIDLRAALDQSPRDSAIFTLMATAHERDGNPELAGERLALAVDVSGAGADESMRYAGFLMRQNRPQVAEKVLTDARNANPANIGVLTQLAQIHVSAQNWAAAKDIAAALRQTGTPEAETAVQALQAAILLGEGRTEDGLAFLQGQIGQGDDVRAIALIVQTQVRNGKVAEARSYLDGEIAKRPDEPQLQLLSAGLHTLAGEADAAEAIFRDLIANDPNSEAPVRLLYGLLLAGGRKDEATAVLDAAVAAQPASGTFAWMKAGELERSGDIDGAIAIYERLYAQDSANVIVANNLASLITTHRDDAESLERAFAIARRLRGSDVPAFQDTYGWIEYRRGNLTEALTYLEPAAVGLPEDALTQFHLGMTYAGLKRPEDARRVLTQALELAGSSPLPQFEVARQTLAALPPAPAP